MTCQRLMPPPLPPTPPHPPTRSGDGMRSPPPNPFPPVVSVMRVTGPLVDGGLSFPQRNYFLSSVALIKTLARSPPPTPQPLPQQIYPSSSCKCGPNMLNKSSLSFQTPTRWSRGGRRASVKAVSRRTLMAL